MYVRIAMLYLEAEDEISAEAFVGRSHAIIGKPDFNNLEVRLWTCLDMECCGGA